MTSFLRGIWRRLISSRDDSPQRLSALLISSLSCGFPSSLNQIALCQNRLKNQSFVDQTTPFCTQSFHDFAVLAQTDGWAPKLR